jgi:hypothetical protein
LRLMRRIYHWEETMTRWIRGSRVPSIFHERHNIKGSKHIP